MAGFSTAITGLKAASTDLDVTGNNIANSSTVGFKSSRTEFGDIYASAVVGAGSSNVAGSGVTVTDIAQNFEAGTTEFTSNNLDLAINGSGFFQLDDGQGGVTYTRAGAFELDKDGYIVSKTGKYLQGYGLDDDGNRLPLQSLAVTEKESPPNATSNIDLSFNINDAEDPTLLSTPYDKDVPATFTYSTTVRTYDSLGNENTIKYNMVEQRPVRDVYAVDVSFPDTLNISGVDVSFDASGTPSAADLSTLQNTDKRIDTSTLTFTQDATAAAGVGTVSFETYSQYSSYGDMLIQDSGGVDIVPTKTERDANENKAYTLGSPDADTELSIGGVAISIPSGSTLNEISALITDKQAEIKDRNPSVESVTVVEEGGTFQLDVRFKAEYGDIGTGFSVAETGSSTIAVLTANADDTYEGDNSYRGQYQMYAYLNGTELLDIGKSVDPGESGFSTDSTDTLSEVGAVMLGFDPSTGFLDSVNGTSFVAGATAPALTVKGADPANTETEIDLDLTDSTQFASASIVKSSSQDGYTKGDLIGVSFAETGEMVASFSNGETQNLGVVAFATFENQSGLQPSGDTEWTATLSSGSALLNPPSTGLNGSLRSAALEQSNVDLSTELVALIEAQRNFQANSKTLETLNTVTQAILQI
ncbi:flagellar hook-basal body complex protein [Amphritea sp. 2_MG-2023]|uniref:flagellar hook protein FlgE n=1 Tax=Amphritea TaxID=515417 RepID=UPI001C07006C|nr:MULTISPECIES: flagellar hook-basal body complex protein [Amphritea]MBU2964847.1 flagellar hook-basal body complex protein [Amphritea atlantica]MDO6419578.1 flagellar hook-basal body complex protein [Amphritea sp. 2_MG-2023]MDX2421364.1 flagellar hook-basal body complex protein [Amphritea sp.]